MVFQMRVIICYGVKGKVQCSVVRQMLHSVSSCLTRLTPDWVCNVSPAVSTSSSAGRFGGLTSVKPGRSKSCDSVDVDVDAAVLGAASSFCAVIGVLSRLVGADDEVGVAASPPLSSLAANE